MSANPIEKYTADITPQEIARMAKVEGLMKLKDSLRHDRESAREILAEIVEQERETFHALEVDIAPLDGLLQTIELVFEGLERVVNTAQFSAMKDR